MGKRDGVDVMAYLRAGYEGCEQRLTDADEEMKTYYTEAGVRARYVHDTVAKLLIDSQKSGKGEDGFYPAVGEPPSWFDEWFIAKLDNGDRVVLRKLPEEYSFDYTTADGTYFKAFRLKSWMQFPDSKFKQLGNIDSANGESNG